MLVSPTKPKSFSRMVFLFIAGSKCGQRVMTDYKLVSKSGCSYFDSVTVVFRAGTLCNEPRRSVKAASHHPLQECQRH